MQVKRIKYSFCIILVLSLLQYSCKNEQRLPDQVTFTQHIAPILYKNCTQCHRPEGNGHFDLITYSQAKNYAASIAYVVRERLMPPWPADPHYTEFVDQKVLSISDVKLIEKWVTDGALEGPYDALPKLPDYPYGSMMGKPDLQLPVKPCFMKANTGDKFLLVKVPYELPNDTFAAVLEFMAGKNNVVHHVNGDMVKYEFSKKKDVFAGELVCDMVEDSTIKQAFEKLGLPNDDGTYPVLQKSVVNYLPGVEAQRYPPGIGGYKLPRKGVFLLNDVHYGFSKKDVWDSSYINVFFSKVPPSRPMMEFQLGTLGVVPVEPDLIVPANTVKKVSSHFTIPSDISIITINPHMHLLGKSFKAYALQPNGDTIRLINIPRWDFNWQYFYTFKKMLKIPKGSTIVAEGVYDNTTQNPNNPFNPPQLIQDQKGSMRSTDEMFQFIVNYVMYKPGDENISLENPKK
ncbi:MAG: hypothetical protein WCG87_10420 [Bacteroidota bacterium]